MQFNIKDSKDREKLLLEIMYYIMDVKYTNRKKFLHIPEEYITEGDYPLGRIWAELKEAYNQNQLSADEIRFLLKIRMQLTDSPQKNLCIWLGRADEVAKDPLEQMEKFSGHCFRHTFATRCFEAGISPKTVQAYMGHATLQMTMNLYTHVTEEFKQSEIEKLESQQNKVRYTENLYAM